MSLLLKRILVAYTVAAPAVIVDLPYDQAIRTLQKN